MEGVAWRETEQVTTLVSLSLQGELGLPGPPGVPGLIVSTQMPGEGNGQEGECGERATSPAENAPLSSDPWRSWESRTGQSGQGTKEDSHAPWPQADHQPSLNPFRHYSNGEGFGA